MKITKSMLITAIISSVALFLFNCAPASSDTTTENAAPVADIQGAYQTTADPSAGRITISPAPEDNDYTGLTISGTEVVLTNTDSAATKPQVTLPISDSAVCTDYSARPSTPVTVNPAQLGTMALTNILFIGVTNFGSVDNGTPKGDIRVPYLTVSLQANEPTLKLALAGAMQQNPNLFGDAEPVRNFIVLCQSATSPDAAYASSSYALFTLQLGSYYFLEVIRFESDFTVDPGTFNGLSQCGNDFTIDNSLQVTAKNNLLNVSDLISCTQVLSADNAISSKVDRLVSVAGVIRIPPSQ
ncbi:hypothetical protein COTS27_00266 [Spirochaetota bacterium]|nr:hypothetical protein COTS27_00266 [Spirochaetota bacterium]